MKTIFPPNLNKGAIKRKIDLELNVFLKDNKDLSDVEKIEKLDSFTTVELLSLVRNIKETPSDYEEEIINAVSLSLFTKGINCI